MVRYKKQYLEAIKEELEEKELLEELLEQLSKHKKGHIAKGNNKKSSCCGKHVFCDNVDFNNTSCNVH